MKTLLSWHNFWTKNKLVVTSSVWNRFSREWTHRLLVTRWEEPMLKIGRILPFPRATLLSHIIHIKDQVLTDFNVKQLNIILRIFRCLGVGSHHGWGIWWWFFQCKSRQFSIQNVTKNTISKCNMARLIVDLTHVSLSLKNCYYQHTSRRFVNLKTKLLVSWLAIINILLLNELRKRPRGTDCFTLEELEGLDYLPEKHKPNWHIHRCKKRNITRT